MLWPWRRLTRRRSLTNRAASLPGEGRVVTRSSGVRHPPIALVAVTATAALLAIIHARAQQPVFRGGVDLVNVTATVTDGNGRFISGLTKDDFVVYDEGKPQEIVTFSSERVSVSLGMLLDVSGSMTEDRLATARAAINHFIFNLLGKEDELFLLEFAARGRMLQTWTRDRDTFSRALAGAKGGPGNFGTALFDAVKTSLGIAADGANEKKLVLILSDGKDTSSVGTVKEAAGSDPQVRSPRVCAGRRRHRRGRRLR